MHSDRRLLTASVLSILLFTLHWADEISRGIEPGTINAVGGFAILAVWLWATLVFSARRWGMVLVLVGAVFAAGVPILHMTGHGYVGGRIQPNSPGAFFWVWTNLALGACGWVSLALSIGALVNWRKRVER